MRVRQPSDFEVTDRGFKHYNDISTSYGHVIKVYESSAAAEPCLWMAVDARQASNGDEGKVHVHLTTPQAVALRDRLDEGLHRHYQNEGVRRWWEFWK